MIATQQSIFGSWVGTSQKVNHPTANDIINAYLEGRKDGKAEAFKEMFDMLFTNLEAAQKISETLFESINQTEIICHKAYLKIENLDSFNIIFQIESDIFYSDAVDQLYMKAIELRKIKNSEHFNISFSFLPTNQALNESRLTSDGFVMTYERK